MNITAPIDEQYLGKDAAEERSIDSGRQNFSVASSDLTLVPLRQLHLPPWFSDILGASKNSASSGPNLSFFACGLAAVQ